MNEIIPLKERKLDIVILIYLAINFVFITYMANLEQNVIPDPEDFTYPLWPPRWLIDALHWYGRNFDRLIMARPIWYRTVNWVDALVWGPFYAFAIYAFVKGRDWIRVPTMLYAGSIMTATTITLGAQITGEYASPHLWVVALGYSMWYIVPGLMVYRMGREHPFRRR